MPRPLLVGGEAFPEFPGGLNRYLHELEAALSSVGVSASSVLIGGSGPGAVSPGPLPARLAGVRRQVARLARESDVVDAHFALYAAAPLLTGGLRGTAFMAHFHGPWADESAAVGHAKTRVALKRLVERAVYRRARRLVVLSFAFKRLLVERYGVSPWKIDVVRPSVDLERFTKGDASAARRRLDLPADALVAVAVRRLVPRMGLDLLLRAWARVQPGTLVIIGQGPERERLERLAAQLAIADRVRFTGAVSEDELASHYRAADLCVLPSLALEGFGLVALEALACGTPVLASDAGGLPEALAGLGEGLVLPRGDEDALGTRLAEALADASSLPSPEHCRAHAERFSRAALGERHREIYAEVAARRAPRRRRRVVYLDHCARLSGAELALANMIDALDVDAHVILGEEGPLVRRLHDSGVSVEVLPLAESARELRRAQVDFGKLGLSGPLRTALYIPRLARRLRALEPDLVHTHSLKSGLYGSIAARLARVPVIWHLHDRLASDYLPSRAAALMRRAVRALPTALIANSDATLATVGGAPRGGARVVPNPIAAPKRAPLRDRVERVGIVGRLTPWKGQSVFLEAFARAFPNPGVEAVVVGAPLFGEEAYEAQLHRLAGELGIADRVEFRGFRPEIGPEMARLDVLVHASILPEPFGQVIVEAMAAEVPVIAAAGGGVSEIASHERTALLHPAGDTEALARALERMASDGQLRPRLAAAGRERAREFRPEVVARQLNAAYDRVAAFG